MKKAFGFVLAVLISISASPSGAAERVNFVLDWVIAGRHTPFFVAVDQGYWKKAGLDVRITRGFGGGNTVKAVGAGTASVGFADPGSAMVARAKGAPIKIVTIFYQKAPFMIVSKAKTGITKPKDLEGKTVGAPTGDANRAVFPAFANVAGIDGSKVNWVTMSPSAKTPSLLADKVQAIPHFAFEKVLFGKLAAKHGQFRFMMYADSGLDIYSNGLQVLESYIKNRSNHLRAFIAGVVKGYEFTFANPKKANDIFAKSQPTVNKDVAFGEIAIIKDLALTEDTKKHCIGWINEKKLARTKEVMFKAFHVKENLDVKDAYTTKFLPCS